MVDEKIIESFHTMWNNFPGVVRLIQKDRMVAAVNKAGEKAGYKTGIRCYDINSKLMHKDCYANKALREKDGLVVLSDDGELVRYWIPVDGYEDLFVHYTIILSEFPPTAANENN